MLQWVNVSPIIMASTWHGKVIWFPDAFLGIAAHFQPCNLVGCCFFFFLIPQRPYSGFRIKVNLRFRALSVRVPGGNRWHTQIG